MKKLAYSIALSLCLISCKKDLTRDLEEQNYKKSYALSNLVNTTAVTTPSFDWETQTTVPITNGTTPILPWFGGSSTLVPIFILNDYKKVDGWELVYNLGQYPGETGQNYLVFYNKFTGIMRCYYYLANNVTGGTNGMWGLELSGTNSLLNNIGHFAKPINDSQLNPIAISSNITIGGTTKAITPGWNAFDTEITFDPSAKDHHTTLRLISFDQNISNMALTGSISLNSEGTIATTSTKNPYQSAASSAAKAAGSEAKNWIKNNVGNKDSTSKFIKVASSSLASIVSGGVSEIVSAGINLIFGSFIGKKNSTSVSNQKIEFKSNGTLTLQGTISSSSGNNVSSVANLWFPGTPISSFNTLLSNYQKQLGVWNLESQPVVKTTLQVPGVPDGAGMGIYTRRYRIHHPSINVIINPDLLSEIQSYTITSDLVYYAKYQGNTNWNNSVWNPFIGEKIYDDGDNQFYTDVREDYIGPEPAPSNPDIKEPLPHILVYSMDKKYVVKVTVTLIPKAGYDQTPIVITRSYLPTYEFE